MAESMAEYVNIELSGRAACLYSKLMYVMTCMYTQVAVRQLASKQAHVLLGGDFRGHLYPVCGLASDEITGTYIALHCFLTASYSNVVAS